MLKKCLRGKTQNANEFLGKNPKNVGLTKLQLGGYGAIVNFNDGGNATLDIFRLLNLDPGYYTTKMCLNSNQKMKTSIHYLKEVFLLRKGEKSIEHRNTKK